MPDEAKLPEPPLRVLATINGVDNYNDNGPWWWVQDYYTSDVFVQQGDDGYMSDGSDLTVVPHPMNDESAVALIEAAKKGTGDG
jgi:hypothetical protein